MNFVEKEDRDPVSLGDISAGHAGEDSAVRFSSKTLLSTEIGASPIPIAAIMHPKASIPGNPLPLNRAVVRCCSCEAVCDPFCNVRSTQNSEWQCVFCDKWNNVDIFGEDATKRQKSLSDFRSTKGSTLQELNSGIVEFLDPSRSAGNSKGEKNHINSSNGKSRACVFIIDANTSSVDINALADVMEEVLSDLCRETFVGIITVGECVNVYDVGGSNPGIISADSFQCLSSLTSLNVDSCLEKTDEDSGVYMSPLHYCKDHIVKIVRNLPGSNQRGCAASPSVSRKEERALRRKQRMMAKARGNRYAGTSLAGEYGKNESSSLSENSSKRCIGTGIEFALGILRSAQEPSGTIIVCTTGKANIGTASTENFDTISERIRHQNSILHIMCVGSSSFNTPLLRKLCHANGGSVTIHRQFGDILAKNIAYATLQSSASLNESHIKINKGMTISVRAQDGLELVHVIGPSNMVYCREGPEVSVNSSVHDFSMGIINPKTAFTFYFSIPKGAKLKRCAYIQFIIKSIDDIGNDLSRVITHRLLSTSSKEAYLKSIDIDVATVAMAKRAVRMAKNQNKTDVANEDICNRIFNTMVYFRECCDEKRFSFPENLKAMPYKLFHLVRGPCMGHILQHEDDIDCIRDTFLTASLYDSIRMMAPRLLCLSKQQLLREGRPPSLTPDRLSELLVEVPVGTLSLQSNCILILDHQSDIFVWSGIEMKGKEYDPVRDALTHIVKKWSEGRFPYPHVMYFNEGDSMSRYLVARLEPLHKDNTFDQLKSYPTLVDMTESDLKNLREKFVWTDDYSYLEWMTHVIKGSKGQ